MAMVKPKVYVETSIPSFYHETRTDPQIVARREWTRKWWADAVDRYSLTTSFAVIDELSDGTPERSRQRLAVLSEVPILPAEPQIAEIVQFYVAHKLMPANVVGDAMHLALASYHKCDFIVTWNCRHLANANKFAHIRVINSMLGLFVPALVTPLELLGESP